MTAWRRLGRLGALGAGLGLGVRALLHPPPAPTTLSERLAAFPRDGLPLENAAVIRWNEHQIPFIEAASDRDAGFVLGLVHAHLRLGQIELLRRIARGRLAEIAGAGAAELDHALRILDLGRAGGAIEAGLAGPTRRWLEAFAAGLNHYQERLARPPHEFALLGIAPEPWRLADLIAIGRLAATDVNWLFWFRLWRLRARDDWPELWRRLLAGGGASPPSFDPEPGTDALARLLAGTGRPGSNAIAIAPARSAHAGALLASDPHLGLLLPNSWLIAGYQSPSYHVVGLMIPGLPFVAVGRNPDIAWGGTNMRAASSALYDVAGLGPEALVERRETIARRGWFARRVEIRESPLGPIVSDAPTLDAREGERVALRWLGHDASDEFTAMLAVNRARDWKEFRDAFAGFAVSGQNMVYADARGNIGQLMAVRLPRRDPRPPRDMVLRPGEDGADWTQVVISTELPAAYNPKAGFLVSANNKPTDAAGAVGYFYSPEDRVRRLRGRIAACAPLDLDDLRELQRDVASPSSARLRDALLEAIERAAPARAGAAAVRELREWDGGYRVDSRGALAFELVLAHFVEAFYGESLSATERAGLFALANLAAFIADDLASAPPARLAAALEAALGRATRDLARAATWGDLHRLRLAHPLARLPLFGKRYVFTDLPAAGSRETVMKTSHGVGAARHGVTYGSNARFLSDLSDPDANYFVLLGGQDGWINSSTFLDQLEPWRRGRDIRLPLSPEAVRVAFPIAMRLQPARP